MKKKVLEKVLNAQKNIIIEGGVSSGKTTNILFPIIENAIFNKESLFILDSKEEYINNYYYKLKENNYNIIIINFRDLDKSEGWNPLEYPYKLYKNNQKDKAQEYLEKIGKVIFSEASTIDPFWSLSSSDLFTGITLGLFEDGKEEEINFNSINAMLDSVSKKYGLNDYLTEYFNYKEKTSKAYTYASTTILAPKDTKGSIIATAKQKLRLYVSRENLTKLFNKTTFDINEINNKPTAVILIGKDENKTFSTIETMFIEQLYGMLIDLRITNKFNMILDNFDTIYKSNELISMLESSISRNIKVFIGTHSIQEMVKNYGEYILKIVDIVSILNNSVQLVISNETHTFRKNFLPITIINSNIDYPKLSNNEIKTFDIESFVKSIKIDNSTQNIDELIKKIDNKIAEIEKENKPNINNMFDAFEGGYFGPSFYYFINKNEDSYEFCYGFSQTGAIIENKKNNPYLTTFKESEEYYNNFITDLLNEVNDWNKEYIDNNTMDGTQWHIIIKELGKKYLGSNSCPQNYDKAVNLIKKYFKVDEEKVKIDNDPNPNEYEQKLLATIKDEVDQEMIKRGLIHIIDGKQVPAFGSINIRWGIEKKLLKEKYNYDYFSPADKHPYIKYD